MTTRLRKPSGPSACSRVSADEAARKKFGKGFVALAVETADSFLQDLAADKVKDARLSLGAWFNELVYPLFVEACFADPIYGGNLGKSSGSV